MDFGNLLDFLIVYVIDVFATAKSVDLMVDIVFQILFLGDCLHTGYLLAFWRSIVNPRRGLFLKKNTFLWVAYTCSNTFNLLSNAGSRERSLSFYFGSFTVSILY